MSYTADTEIRLTSLKDQHGIALSVRQRDKILHTNPGLAPFATGIPIFIVLLRYGKAIACGGLRPIHGEEDSAAETKRVYVVPEARGQAKGILDLFVRQLERLALKRGWTTVRLQTGSTMLSTNRFYERHGYRLIPNYGDFIDSEITISYERVLADNPDLYDGRSSEHPAR